jgi:hypothetical protein
MLFRAAFLAMLVCPTLFGQFSGRVTGMVVDPSGAVVPAAVVTLQLPGSSRAVLSATSAGDGTYHFSGARPGNYDLSAQAPGFVKATVVNVLIDPARETTLPAIALTIGAASTVDVSAEAESVQTGNAEISSTISTAQVEKLPVLDRDPLGLIQTQAGVASNGNGSTVINGMRTSFANVTLDCIISRTTTFAITRWITHPTGRCWGRCTS